VILHVKYIVARHEVKFWHFNEFNIIQMRVACLPLETDYKM